MHLEKTSTIPLTTTLLRNIFIPLLTIYAIHLYRPYWLQPRQTTLPFLFSIFMIFGVWVLITFKLLENARNQDNEDFLKKYYHARIILLLMKVFTKTLSVTIHFVLILRKPFLFSWLIALGCLILKKSIVLPYLEKYFPFYFLFTITSVLAVFFLTAREDTLISKTQRSLKNIEEKTVAFKKWVYKLDTPEIKTINESFIPKDKIPSVIYFATHFFKVSGKYLLRALILFLTKYKIKKALIVLLPLVAIGEFGIFIFNLLILGLYGAISFTLRLIFYAGYFVGFFAALYYNIHNLILTLQTKSPHQFLNGLIITFAIFFILECIRHLNLELPLYSRSHK